ncbi:MULTISPECIES: thioesterase family protein [unclassified Curtobacterium]|uniref:acyl-CoA thioesterase n=1 Tax=unclassified Curtobacterium TaxID=257496 RepID=UPI000DAA4AE2|nr:MULTISPECIES: thioesterase family protein [unclassified Curtobacterium]PZF26996.1 acyl-CoA thioesterase [Curtobacterium sp. MCPF17_051]WIB69540.1 thioesterase family protein [Curtobacterium sp. MCBD17_026]
MTIDEYPFRRTYPTRWNDNDMFGHVNNTIYYSAMDNASTYWFREVAGLDPFSSEWIAVLVSSSCRFVESAVWPDVIEVGMRSKHLGNTSLSWEFGLFRQSDGALLATGEFVHVIIDREGARRPIPLPAELRELVTGSMVAPQPAVAD